MNQNKKAILVVSFGTSHEDTRIKTFDALEADLKQVFSDYEFRKAYTSPRIIQVLKTRDGIQIDSVQEALEKLVADGFRQVLVQPTFVIEGFEYDKLVTILESFQEKFDSLVWGKPLLSSDADHDEVAKILTKELKPYQDRDQTIVFMGHGTEHVANVAYNRLQDSFIEEGLADGFIGTVDSTPGVVDMIEVAKDFRSTKVLLIPFMIVAGEHALKDMSGEQEDSWKSQFIKAGLEVKCLFKGLGEYKQIRDLFIAHAKDAATRLGCGYLYGIGVGPGDPELMTLKAVHTIKSCDVIMVPGENFKESVAYKIAVQSVPEIDEKECVSVPMPMTRNQEVLCKSHDQAAETVIGYLEQGKRVGFLNLGDVTVYATYLYVHRRVKEQGYIAILINGITSFCAAAARVGVGLVEGLEQLHLLSQPDQIEEGLKLPGTKVIMKMGKNMAKTKQEIVEANMEAVMIERCGMKEEKIYRTAEQIDESAGYYSLLIVKNKK